MRKSVLAILGVSCIALATTGCTIVNPDVGHEAVLVHRDVILYANRQFATFVGVDRIEW